MLIVNGTVLTMAGRDYENGYVWIRDGKIAGVGPVEQAPEDEQVYDARQGYITPGLIDAHCHVGLFGDGLGFEGEDGNESTDPITPQLRAIDGVNMQDRCFSDARNAGVTTVVTGPGSANVIGGQIVALKTAGNRVDDAVIKEPLALKVAFGENPKTVYHEQHKTPMTRMATAAVLRQALMDARAYAARERKERVDLKLEPLVQVLSGELPVHAHAHRADDMFTALRIAKEFDIELKLIHGTEGHLIADYLIEEKVPVMVGPTLCDRCKPELANLSFETARTLSDRGACIALITDHPVIPIQYLLLTAQLAAKHGMDKQAALRAITSDAAKLVGIDQKVGKIAPGMDGDVVIFNKHPLDFCATAQLVLINGEKVNK